MSTFRGKAILVVIMTIGLLGVPARAARAAAPEPAARTERVSVASDGSEGERHSGSSSSEQGANLLSADGRYVVFVSAAQNLVTGDTNVCGQDFRTGADIPCSDVFVRDRVSGETERVSVASDETQATGNSQMPAISADGRYVAFQSDAPDLVAGDTNERGDIFVRDRVAGTTERVSIATDGTEGNSSSESPSISEDGRTVTFSTFAGNLIPADTNGAVDVLAHDRTMHTTELISVSSAGVQATSQANEATVTPDGRFVAFQSNAPLEATDTNNQMDVYVRDRQGGTTELLSTGTDGTLGNNWSGRPVLSANGRYVAFYSQATTLVPWDTNNAPDIFVHDRQTGETSRVTVAADGSESAGGSRHAAISADGRFVAFWSAGNLVPVSPATGGIFVHDRKTGAVERASIAHDGSLDNGNAEQPAISGDGRTVVFTSGGTNLVPGYTIRCRSGSGNPIPCREVYVRSRGPAVGIGDLAADANGSIVSVAGWARLAGTELSSAGDPNSDGTPGAPAAGGEITSASVTYRPESKDLLLRVGLAGMPSSNTRVAPVLYGFNLNVLGTPYQVRAQRTTQTTFVLAQCAGCAGGMPLGGGIGSTGPEVTVAVPLAAIGALDGSVIGDMRAFTGTGSADQGAQTVIDDVTLNDAVIPSAQVSLGIATPGTPESDVSYATEVLQAGEAFTGTLDAASLPPGTYNLWARACVKTTCGARSVSVTTTTGGTEPPPPPPPPPPACTPADGSHTDGRFSPAAPSLDPGTIRTFAGGGLGDGGNAAYGSLWWPQGVSVEEDGDILVADHGNRRIRKVDARTRKMTTVAGTTHGFSGDGGPATEAKMADPVDVLSAGGGVFYFTDTPNQRVRKVDANGIITTVAGNGTGDPNDQGGEAVNANGDGRPATLAALYTPVALVLDAQGNLYIAEFHGQRVRRVDGQTGIITTFAGTGVRGFSGDGGPATQATFHYPTGLAFGPDDDLYIADEDNHRIRKVDTATGIITTVVGTTHGFDGDGGPAKDAKLRKPAGIAFDDDGNLLITDFGNALIRKVDTDGTISTIAGGGNPPQDEYPGEGIPATDARLVGPWDVDVDAAGNVYVADQHTNSVRKVSAKDGTISSVASTADPSVYFGGDTGPARNARLWGPTRAAVGPAGDVYFTDMVNSRVRRIDRHGRITTVAGNGRGTLRDPFNGDCRQAKTARLMFPHGVAVDDTGALYIADSWNHRIRKVGADGKLVTIAGSDALDASLSDGIPATRARIIDPRSVDVGPDGTVYIAETNGHRVRKVTPDGIITTIAGAPGYGFAGDGGPAKDARMTGPLDVELDAAGNLYVADLMNNRVRKISTDGIMTTVAGNGQRGYSGDGGPATAAALAQPEGVETDAAGNLYIADTDNDRIRKVDAVTGIISTVAGGAGTEVRGVFDETIVRAEGSLGDGGPAVAANLHQPRDVTIDAAGNMLITDNFHARIRQVVYQPVSGPDAVSIPTIAVPETGARLGTSAVTLSGHTEPDFSVTVYEDGMALGTTAADSTGAWSLSRDFSERTHLVDATAANADGKVSAHSDEGRFTVDLTAPSPPVIKTPEEGGLTSGSATVSGTAAPGALVEVAEGGATIAMASANSSGRWSVSHSFTDGAHAIEATAADDVGNRSAPSSTRSFTVDAVAPPLPVIAEPGEGAVVPTASVTIAGTAEAGARVEVREGAAVLSTTTAAADGSWSVSRTFIDGSSHKVTAVAKDAVGNASGPSALRSFTVQVDSAAPAPPALTSPSAGTMQPASTSVSGSVEPRATVRLFEGSRLVQTIYTGPDGKFQRDVLLGDGPRTLRVIARDAAGNESDPTEVSFEVDARKPTVTIITPSGALLPGDRISGGATDEHIIARVEVTYLDLLNRPVTIQTASCEGCGTAQATWSATPPAAGYYKVRATSYDLAGNASTSSSIWVVYLFPGI